jgi:hypothetical protein
MADRRSVTDSAPGLLGGATATFSPDRAYRYQLTRTWSDAPAAAWVMLNPSTAGAADSDMTIGRCVSFARSWGYGGIIAVNLHALIATDPRELARAGDPAGEDADWHITDAARRAGLVMAAWGAHPMAATRGPEVAAMLAAEGVALHCLGVTRDGSPRHPLYVRGDVKPVPYRSASVTVSAGKESGGG